MTDILNSNPARRLLALVAVLFPLLLGGCQESMTESVGNLLSNPFGSSDEDEEVINVVALNPGEVAWHIQTAVAATVLRLKGEEPDAIEAKFNIVGSGGIANDENTDLSGFGVEKVQLNDFFTPEDAPGINRLGATLVLVEPAGRRVGISFVADYELSGDQVILQGHQWGYMRAENPLVETYIVPTAAIEKMGEDGVRDYTTLRTQVLLNAVAAGAPGASEDMSDLTIVTFFMDHLLHGDKVELRISDVKDGPEGYHDDSRYILHDNGWVTGIVPGQFSLAAENAFWVKAVFIPKKRENDGFFGGLLSSEQVIGLYNTANLTTPAS
ncbi:MAG: hypothetical protein CMN56_03435 [Sneathiella sp.]|uniref:hypothetical protein n=1 Tax=Sneathiella sp. TaxID=1964365 RepID=UPI000C406BCF|nr:hypothetical protein [Sneathiella sp.]MAZ02169.1 hypothetical protein [Sneathiella sp.]